MQLHLFHMRVPKIRIYFGTKGFLLLVTIFAFLFSTQMHAGSCVFCTPEIVEAQAVFKGEYFDILLDYRPRVPGHLLVVLKRHVVKAHELCLYEWAELSSIVPKIVSAFSECLGTDDFIILEKNGPHAFQQVPHVHFHLLPVHSETWTEIFGTVPRQLSPEELEQQVDLFRSYFNQQQALK